ncbi:MAG TPA: DUF4058 family protein, partial [Chroococcidiopsis sp.]
AAALRPRYYVEVEKRVYLSVVEDSVLVGIPDVSVFSRQPAPQPETDKMAIATLPSAFEPITVTVPVVEEVQERYLEIREVGSDVVITTIELLSPKNKQAGEGRNAYLQKRQQILASLTHLIEIDLLRAGLSMPLQGAEVTPDYQILVSRADQRPKAQLYAFGLHDPIPTFPLPLRSGDQEPLVNLKEILEGVYDRAGYDLRINYAESPQPALTSEHEAWVDALLKEAGLRS